MDSPSTARSLCPPEVQHHSDSYYRVKIFATKLIRPRSNKKIFDSISRLLQHVRQGVDISISQTPACRGPTSSVAKWNAVTDSSAVWGSVGACFSLPVRPEFLSRMARSRPLSARYLAVSNAARCGPWKPSHSRPCVGSSPVDFFID